jgi:hypothetical protein
MNQERRKRERVALQCPVRIVASADGLAGDAMAVNISCQGIYWISQLPFTPGEQVSCAIFIPPNGFRSDSSGLSLNCRVRVVRVEEASGGFGVGCRIEEYGLAKVQIGSAVQDTLQMLCEQRAEAV